MNITINDVDSEQYNATLLNKDIQPATVIVYRDWMRQGLNPLNYGTKQTYKVIKLSFYVENVSEDAVTDDISGLCAALQSCTLKFSDLSKYYDSALADSSPILDTKIRPGVHQLDVTLQSSYAYLPPITVPLTGQSQSITAQGNLPSPAVVTLTPSQDIGSVTLTGLTKHDITVSNLHDGATVTIDGEACIVTEPDLDTIMTSDMGGGKWMVRKYQVPNMFSPDTINASIVPDKSMISSGAAYTQQLIADAANLYQDSASNYLVHLKTGLYVSTAKTVTLKFLHDDGVNVLLNGTSVYSHAKAEDNGGNPGYPSVSLPLNAGWNTLEILVLNHYGMGGIWDIQTTIASQVDQLNAYYTRDADPTGVCNKFGDCDLWSMPVVQPGVQTVAINSSVVAVNVQYKPKFF